MYWDDKPYHSLNYYLRQKYGEKVFKISLDGGFTCPNRDGKIDTRGCIFCSAGGSGDFASSRLLSITDQIEDGKSKLQGKYKGNKFIAYFQAYTNTYGSLQHLEKVFTEAIQHPDIVGLSIGTRPDCLNDQIVALLKKLNAQKEVWVELGLQTIHESTSQYIRRGYALKVYDQAVDALHDAGIPVITHLILGLPGETKDMMLQSVNYVARKAVHGIKLQLLHVLKDTDLAEHYHNNHFDTLEREAYIDLVVDCIECLPPDMVVHRLTGDAPRRLLIAPRWSTDKKNIFNHIHRTFKDRETYQGKIRAVK